MILDHHTGFDRNRPMHLRDGPWLTSTSWFYSATPHRRTVVGDGPRITRAVREFTIFRIPRPFFLKTVPWARSAIGLVGVAAWAIHRGCRRPSSDGGGRAHASRVRLPPPGGAPLAPPPVVGTS